MRYAHARTIQVAPRFGKIRFQTFSLSVNPGSPNAPTHKQADRASVSRRSLSAGILGAIRDYVRDSAVRIVATISLLSQNDLRVNECPLTVSVSFALRREASCGGVCGGVP